MESPARPSPFDSTTKIVLLVDDSPLALKSMRTLLEQLGFIVMAATNGHEAVELAPMFPFAAIITDIEMPGMDGLEALSRIRDLGGACADIPAAVVSGRYPGPDTRTCRELGIELFVTKGAGFQDLIGFLAQVRNPRSEEYGRCG
jgi:CheY-like chemotaxis protein